MMPTDPEPIYVSKPSGRVDIHALLAVIDSIYALEGHKPDTQTVRLTDTSAYPVLDTYHLLRFDREGALGYFTYLTFEFIEYRSSGAADSAFTSVELLTEMGTLRTSDTKEEYARVREANSIFSKAGSTFLLLGNVIMHHERRCNYSHRDVVREEQLVDNLFERYSNVRMMQGLCGWGKVTRRP